MFLDSNTPRAELEVAAIVANLDLDKCAAASDEELLEMIQEWIAEGDECFQF